MFSWIHYPGLLTPGKRAMRGSVFWTLALCVIVSGIVYTMTVTARDVQAQTVVDPGESAQPVETPPEDARQSVEGPQDDARQSVEGPQDDARQSAEGPPDGAPVEGPPGDAQQPVEGPPEGMPATVGTAETVGDFFALLGGGSVLPSLPDSFKSKPLDVDRLVEVLPSAGEPVDVEGVIRAVPEASEADAAEVEEVLEGLPEGDKVEPVDVEELEDLGSDPQGTSQDTPAQQDTPPAESTPEESGEQTPGEQTPDQQVAEDPDSGNDSGTDGNKASSPECEAASEELDKEKDEDSISSQTIADYENKCLDGEVTIDLSDDGDAAGEVAKGTKVVIGTSVGLGVPGLAGTIFGARFTYLSWKLQRDGVNPQAAEEGASAFIDARQNGASPQEAASLTERSIEMTERPPQNTEQQNTEEQQEQESDDEFQDAQEQPDDPGSEEPVPEGPGAEQQTEGPNMEVEGSPEDGSPRDTEGETFGELLDQIEQNESNQEQPEEDSADADEEEAEERVVDKIVRYLLEEHPDRDEEETKNLVREIREENPEFDEQATAEVADFSIVVQEGAEDTGDDKAEEEQPEEEQPEPTPEETDDQPEQEEQPKTIDEIFGETAAPEELQWKSGDRIAKELRSKLKEEYPGRNVMVIQQETYDKPENIEGVVEKDDVAFYPEPTSVTRNRWDVYVFESGTFTNTGDLGYNNWAFGGNYERSSGDEGETVTFEPIESESSEGDQAEEEQPEPGGRLPDIVAR